MELDDLLISCMRCGFCQSVCPVYGETFLEADVTRGKIALLEDLAHELTADAEKVNQRLNRCLLCGSCETNCPSGVSIIDIFLRARAVVAGYKGLGLIKKTIFRFVLPRPRLFNFFIRISSLFQGPFLKKQSEKPGAFTSPILTPFLGRRHIPKLSNKSFSSIYGEIDEPSELGKVALFPGCVPDKVFTKLSDTCLKVLRHHKVGIYLARDLVCCGIPALASGDFKAFVELTKINLDLLAKSSFDYLVSPCATCASNIKENWHRFSDSFESKQSSLIEEICAKTMDLTAYLVKILRVDLKPKASDNKVVTYHDPCHLNKSLGVSAEPRELLKSLPGYQFKEMPEADRCCGNGGSFNLFNYPISKKIGQVKRDNIVSVKPSTVATSCPACMLQLMDLLSQNKDDIEVKHVIELYAETL
jgi:glycolate oxidase iron-sulfur subunit